MDAYKASYPCIYNNFCTIILLRYIFFCLNQMENITFSMGEDIKKDTP